eukprot:Seg3021.3 transcript_id=Seg3021.3/GoldUCD/mRNA.D3Y31 product="JmjC domain-containing protein 5" protein_id=Seg3021.3/GoldUCD/D3Y31
MARAVLFVLGLVCISNVLASVEQMIPPGHLKPFGEHAEPMPLEEMEDIPDAKTFMEKYVFPSRPVVFRNAAKKFPAYKLWTEEYLKEKYGDLEIRLENKLEKEGYTPSGAKGVGRDTVEEFLNTYKNEPKYIVSELPSPMYQDIMALPCMSCGPAKKRMVEIDLWMSSGSSQSILHKDAFNTMNCLINGTKEWKIVLYKYEKDLYKAYEEGDPAGGYSKINVRSVDMLKYPKVATLPYYNITVHGGDCLFLPKSTYHQVNSLPGFNLAVTILFSRFDYDKPKNFKDCNATTEKFTPLTEFDIDWMFPGKGYMTMGYGETFLTKSQFYRNAKSGQLTSKSIFESMIMEKDPFTGAKIDEKFVADALGVKPGQIITKEHVLRLTKKQIRKVAVPAQGLFTSNAYDYEFYKISPRDIAKLIAVLVKRDGHLKRKNFVEWYVAKLYGTKLYADAFFDKLTGKDVQEVSKDVIMKNFMTAAEKYSGDDGLEDYDPNAKHREEEDRGEAYIFVKKDIQKEERDEKLLKDLNALVEEKMGGGEEQEENDNSPEDEEEEQRGLREGEDEEEGGEDPEGAEEGAEEGEGEEGAEEEPQEETEKSPKSDGSKAKDEL